VRGAEVAHGAGGRADIQRIARSDENYTKIFEVRHASLRGSAHHDLNRTEQSGALSRISS
jgi:hypothetical protein